MKNGAALLLAALLGCAAAATPTPEGLREALLAADDSAERGGLCDASAAVWLDAGHLAVADDESNALFVYRVDGVEAVTVLGLDTFLQADPKHPEADLEAVATLDGLQYWLGSHGRSKNGKERPGRRRFFATRWNGARLETVGAPYTLLSQDLGRDPRYEVDASRVEFEALAARDDGTLLLGARSPLHRGRALAIPLLNPLEVVRDGAAARFGEPLEWDLDGRGVRAIESLGERGYLVSAGAAGNADTLYHWSGRAGENPLFLVEVPLNVEALAYDATRRLLSMLSDDGTRRIDGVECKLLPEAGLRRFRAREAVWPR